MARPLRIEFPGACYHVMSRGNEQRVIVRDDRDRTAFVEILGWAVKKSDVRLHAFVPMGNHYHLLLETPRPCLSRAKFRAKILEVENLIN